jgi:hypothetical protein
MSEDWRPRGVALTKTPSVLSCGAGMGIHCELDPGLAAVRDILLIAGFDVLHETAYECVLEIERYAAKLGYRPIV